MKWYETATFFHMYPFGMIGAPKHNDGSEGHHFEELEEWIPHLEELGITALYIGPLFESSTHGYDTKDFYKIDRRLGTNEEWKHFVETCHKHGIKVVVDGVFNHTGKEFFAFKDILENREHSRYVNWYKNVDFSRWAPSGEPFYFEAWRNIYDLANLNLYNPEVRSYLLDVVSFWIDDFNIDGIRLDCSDCLAFDFMKELRQLTDAKKEDFWLMGELIHGDYSRWIQPDMLHSSTNYELHKALYSSHNDHNYFEVAHSIKRQFDENGGIYKGMHLYSFVDNHDVDRIASKLNNKNHLLPVHMLLYTLPGIPSIYYGSQWGIEGRKEGGNDDPLRPRLYLKDMITHNPHPELTSLLTILGRLKKQYKALSYGSYHELVLRNKQYAFSRTCDDKCIVTAVNNDEINVEINIPANEYHCAVSLLNNVTYPIENGQLTLTLSANNGDILLLKKEALNVEKAIPAIKKEPMIKEETISVIEKKVEKAVPSAIETIVPLVKIELYTGEEHIKTIADALAKEQIGTFKRFSHVVSYCKIREQFKTDVNGQLYECSECKVDIRCPYDKVAQALEIIYSIVPKEDTMINLISLLNDQFHIQ